MLLERSLKELLLLMQCLEVSFLLLNLLSEPFLLLTLRSFSLKLCLTVEKDIPEVTTLIEWKVA